MRKPSAANESSTYTALLASQNKNIVAMMKIAIAFKYGSITDNLACNSGCGELIFIFSKVPHLEARLNQQKTKAVNLGEAAYFTKHIYQGPELCF